MALYDVSSSYLEGCHCLLARRGYSRNGRQGTLQIVYGRLGAPDGCPVTIRVFDSNTDNPTTLASQIAMAVHLAVWSEVSQYRQQTL